MNSSIFDKIGQAVVENTDTAATIETPAVDIKADPDILKPSAGLPDPERATGPALPPLTQAVLAGLPNPANDLPPGHLYTFDAQAEAAKANANVETWFSDKWRNFTAREAWNQIQRDAAENERKKAEEAALYQQGTGNKDQPTLDTSGSGDAYSQAIQTLKSMPQRPGQAPLPDINPYAAAFSFLGALVTPQNAFDLGAAPLAFGLQQQAIQTQHDQQLYQDRVAQLTQIAGIQEHQAVQMAENERVQYQQKMSAFNQDLDRTFRAKDVTFEAGQRWGQMVYSAQNEMEKMTLAQKFHLVDQMVAALNDPAQAPGVQARAAAFLQAAGIPLQALKSATPQQQQQILSNAMLDLQVKKTRQMTPLEVAQARENLGILKIQRKYMPDELQSKIDLIRSEANKNWQQPGLEARGQDITAHAHELQYGALGSARQAQQTIIKLKADLADTQTNMGVMEDEAKVRLKKDFATDGKWFPWEPGWFQNKEDREKYNKSLVEQDLAKSGEYRELKRKAEDLKGQIANAQQAATDMYKIGGKGDNPVAAGDLGQKYRDLGAHYVWGGTSDKALDCSAFTQRVYGDQHVSLPRTAQEQYNYVQKLPGNQAGLGDLVFFGQGADKVKHVGVIVGFGEDGTPLMRHMSSAKDGVQDVNLESYISSVKKIGYQIVGVGRPKPAGDHK